MKIKTAQQNLWNTLKATLRGKYIALSTYTKKLERVQINDLNTQLKNLE